jgi:predicted aspartyl protease
VRALVLLSVVAALAGCGGAQGARGAGRGGPPRHVDTPIVAATVPSTATVTGDEPHAAHHATLRFELNGRAFPLPLVHGSIAGMPVWMLVDTGANSHVIARWVAQRLGLSMRALGDIGSDHTGRAVAAYMVEHTSMTIDEWGPLADKAMLVTDVPEPIARIGIGAFVSPQWLAEQGDGVVLDIAKGEMHTAAWDDAVAELDGRGGRSIGGSGAHLCQDDASAIHGLAFVLPASVDGKPVDLLLDTGAHRTDLLSTSKAAKLLVGRSAPSREQMFAASGLVKTRIVRAVDVRVAEWATTTDIDLVPGVADAVCPRDGVVSMDVLQSCTLVLGPTGVLGRCGSP